MREPLSSKPWATTSDAYGDPSGELVGNTAGLRRLRDLIDEAIQKGEVTIEKDAGFDFCAIKVQELHPEEKKPVETRQQKLTKFGCLSVLAILGLLVIVGLFQVFAFFTK